MGRRTCKIQDSDLKTGDLYNDGTYSGKVKSVSSDEIVIESQNEDGDVVDITIPVTDDASEAEIREALMDPEFVSDMIEAASNGENKVESYRDNGDGTVDVKIARPVTQEEAQYLNEVGVFVGVEGMNKAGWITVSANPIADSADPDTEWDAMTIKLWNGEKVMKPEHWSDEDWVDFVSAVEDFDLSDDNPEGTILKQDGNTAWLETPGLEEFDDDYYEGVEDSAMSDYWIKVKRDLTRTLGGSWKLRESGNNGIKITATDFPEGLEDKDVADFVTNNFPFRYDGKVGNDYLFIKDSELSVGDEYNDGKYSGKVTEINADGIKIESEDENGNKTEITVPVSDSVKYRVYYPSKNGSDKMEFEEFEGSEAEAKGAAEDFAANFGREKTIIHKVTDSAVHTVSESNINDIFDKGTTTVVYDPEETDPADIVMEIEDELALGAAPGEGVPELDFEVIDDNTIEIFVV